MKKSILNELFKHIKQYDESLIITYLKKTNEYDEDFIEIQLEEVKKFLNKQQDLNINKERINSRNLKSLKDNTIYTLKMLNENDLNNVILKIQSIIKYKIKNNDILSNFDYKLRNIQNYNNIDLNKFVDFKDLNKKIYFSNNKYKVLIYVDDIVIKLTIYDLIELVSNKETFKEQLDFLNILFDYSKFELEFKESIIDNNKLNLLKFEELLTKTKKIKRLKDTYRFLVNYANNTYNTLNVNTQNEYYFFIAYSKICEETNTKLTITSQNVKMLNLLGIIKNVNYETISLEEEIRINKDNQFKNVKLYSIQNFDIEEVLKTIELLNEKDIDYKNLTEKVISEKLGEEFKNRVF